MRSGVYIIENSIDGRVYIGSSININSRWEEHKRSLKKGTHANIHLQRFVSKYGLKSLSFKLIEKCDPNLCLEREQHYLDSTDNKFNICEFADAPMKGRKHKKETLLKISKKTSGINNPMFGRRRKQSVLDAVSRANKGRLKSMENRIKRIINLPNRAEITLINDKEVIRCFSMTHASDILKVSRQSVSKALKNSGTCSGYRVVISDKEYFDKDTLLNNFELFSEKLYPKEIVEGYTSTAGIDSGDL